MTKASSSDVQLSLAFDMLADMILKHFAKPPPEEVRKAILDIMEQETEEQLDFELTVELLGTDDFRVVA